MSELAKLIGKEGQTVYRWEAGRTRPSFADLEALAALYEITVGELVDGVSPAERSPESAA